MRWQKGGDLILTKSDISGKIIIKTPYGHEYVFDKNGITPSDEVITLLETLYRIDQTDYVPVFIRDFANWLVSEHGWKIKENTVKFKFNPKVIY